MNKFIQIKFWFPTLTIYYKVTTNLQVFIVTKITLSYLMILNFVSIKHNYERSWYEETCNDKDCTRLEALGFKFLQT